MHKAIAIVIFCACLATATLVAGRSHHHHHRRTTAGLHYSPELMRELRDFLDLIPSVTIDELVAEHLLIDGGFRKAIKFLRSADFKRLQQRAEQLPEVIEVINFVHLNDSAVGDSGRGRHGRCPRQAADYSIANQVQEEVVVLLLLGQPKQQLGSFISFVKELLTHLPRDRFVALINEKRQRNAIFAKFYAALRSEEFQPLVERAMQSQNVASIISTLSSHAIDAQSLKSIGFEVISWGPI